MNTARDLLPAIGQTGGASFPAAPPVTLSADRGTARTLSRFPCVQMQSARLTGARVRYKTGRSPHLPFLSGRQLAVEHRSRAFYPTHRAHCAIYGAKPFAGVRRGVRQGGAGPLEWLPANVHPVHATPPSFGPERRRQALAISRAHVFRAKQPVMCNPIGCVSTWDRGRNPQSRLHIHFIREGSSRANGLPLSEPHPRNQVSSHARGDRAYREPARLCVSGPFVGRLRLHGSNHGARSIDNVRNSLGEVRNVQR